LDDRPFKSNREFLERYTDVLKTLCKARIGSDSCEPSVSGNSKNGVLRLPLLPEPDPALLKQYRSERQNLRARIAATVENGDVSIPLVRLTKGFGLTEMEEAVLVSAIAYESTQSFEQLVTEATKCCKYSIKAILWLFCEDEQELLHKRALFMPNSRLVRNGLLTTGSHRNWNALSVDDFLSITPAVPLRISNAILGLDLNNGIDDGCMALVESKITLEETCFPTETREAIRNAVVIEKALDTERIHSEPEAEGEPRIVLLFGEPGSGKCMAAGAIASMLGKKLLRIRTTSFIQKSYDEPEDLNQALGLARINDAVPCFTLADRLLSDDPEDGMVEVFSDGFASFGSTIILTVNGTPDLTGNLGRSVTQAIHIPSPSIEHRMDVLAESIQEHIPRADDLDLKALAERFEIPDHSLRRIARVACLKASTRDSSDRELRMTDFFARTEEALEKKEAESRKPAYSTTPVASLDSVVLPAVLRRKVLQFISAASSQQKVFDEWGLGETYSTGHGISALFYGPSGTGKTLTAEAIAHELGKSMRIVQLARMMDRYVGETEKHTARVFSLAETNGEVLVFDEADALFATRVTGYKDGSYHINSHINTLLKEMDDFKGIVILTTNRALELDPAFERRIRWKLEFPLPDAETRLLLWKKLIPGKAPLADDVDFPALAQEFDFPGGFIRSSVLKAAFAAASEELPISMAHLRDAAFSERLCDSSKRSEVRIGFQVTA